MYTLNFILGGIVAVSRSFRAWMPSMMMGWPGSTVKGWVASLRMPLLKSNSGTFTVSPRSSRGRWSHSSSRSSVSMRSRSSEPSGSRGMESRSR